MAATDIWAACKERAQPIILSGTAIRVVESQEQIATNALVDDLAEQAQLEALLEQAKPPAPRETRSLHYLLATPFRYPPLRHGSRFGSRHEPSLFYGAVELHTALAETAYYRLLFWAGMTTPPPSGKLVTAHTVFGAAYRSEKGLRLQDPPFDEYRTRIANPASYEASQRLGHELRQAGIEAFQFPSARDQENGINVALFTAKALRRKQPMFQQQWLCETDAERVMFFSVGQDSYWYQKDSFLLDGELPSPAL